MTEAVVEEQTPDEAASEAPARRKPEVQLKLYLREEIGLTLERREETGKGPVGRLRREGGMVPGVLYGHNQEGARFKVNERMLERLLSRGAQNAILLVDIDGGDQERAVVKEIQYHKVHGTAVHLDLLRVDPQEVLRVSVPVTMQGTPVGVRAGGALQQSMSAIELECPAVELPSGVEIDVSELDVGHSIHVSDLLEQESRIVTDPGRTICTVLTPRLVEEEVTAEEDEEGVEGVEGEEAPEGEAAAEEGGADAAE